MKTPASRKNISRDRIEENAMALFRKRGVEETSVNDIVARAGIAKGTFYLYFRSKDDLVNAVFDRYRAAFISAVVEGNRDDFKILNIAPAIIDYFQGNALFLAELRRALYANRPYAYMEKTVRSFTEVIIQFLNLNEQYPIKQVDTYSRMIIGMIIEICHGYVVDRTIASREEALTMLEDLLKRFFNCE